MTKIALRKAPASPAQLIYQTSGPPAAKYSSAGLSGDHIGKVLPVPIPNTEVKLFEPMIVHTSVKVGIARFLKNPLLLGNKGFFHARSPLTVARWGFLRRPGLVLANHLRTEPR